MLLDADGISWRGKLFCRVQPRASSMAISCSRHVQAFENFYTLHLMRAKILHDKGSKEASILGDPHGLGVQFAFASPAASKLESVWV
jgi:hypothetical protein